MCRPCEPFRRACAAVLAHVCSTCSTALHSLGNRLWGPSVPVVSSFRGFTFALLSRVSSPPEPRLSAFQLASVFRPDGTGLTMTTTTVYFTYGFDPCPSPPTSLLPWLTCDANGNIVTLQPGMGGVCAYANCSASLAATTPANSRATGTIPSSIGALTALQILEFSNYGANYGSPTTALPTQLGLLTALTRLGIWNTGPSGTLPTELGLLTNLNYLDFASGYLVGTIPTQLGLLTQLTYLDLSSNSLSGPARSPLFLPMYFSHCRFFLLTAYLFPPIPLSLSHLPSSRLRLILNTHANRIFGETGCLPHATRTTTLHPTLTPIHTHLIERYLHSPSPSPPSSY